MFSCANPIIGKNLFQDLYVKCRVVQPDWRILWSSISMEGINSYHRLFELASGTTAIVLVWIGLVVSSQIAGFFHHQNICNQLISSIWKYWFCFGVVSVASQIQICKSSGRSSVVRCGQKCSVRSKLSATYQRCFWIIWVVQSD